MYVFFKIIKQQIIFFFCPPRHSNTIAWLPQRWWLEQLIVGADEGRIVEDEITARGAKCAEGLVCLIGRTDEPWNR